VGVHTKVEYRRWESKPRGRFHGVRQSLEQKVGLSSADSDHSTPGKPLQPAHIGRSKSISAKAIITPFMLLQSEQESIGDWGPSTEIVRTAVNGCSSRMRICSGQIWSPGSRWIKLLPSASSWPASDSPASCGSGPSPRPAMSPTAAPYGSGPPAPCWATPPGRTSPPRHRGRRTE